MLQLASIHDVILVFLWQIQSMGLFMISLGMNCHILLAKNLPHVTGTYDTISRLGFINQIYHWPSGGFSCIMTLVLSIPLLTNLSPPFPTTLNSFTHPPDLSTSNKNLSSTHSPNLGGAKPAPHNTPKIFSAPCSCAVYPTQPQHIWLQNLPISYIFLCIFLDLSCCRREY